MILPFQTKWPKRMGELAGQPNYFPWKILIGIEDADIVDIDILESYFNSIVAKEPRYPDNSPKLHTIRHDPHDRWKPCMKVHFAINNRTKDYFQFAPVIEVKSVQEIEIMAYETDVRTGAYYTTFLDNYRYKVHQVKIDNRPILIKECSALALNDGFPSVEAFFQYFNEDSKLKIIHWTDLIY